MKDSTPIAVCSRSFSREKSLRAALLNAYENVRFNDTGAALSKGELVEFLRGAKKAIVALETIDDRVLEQLPELEVIAKFGVGIDRLDLEALDRHEVRLGWTGGVNKRAVAEMVISLSVNLLRGIHLSNQEVRAGEWRPVRGRELGAVTFGVLGCGNIGKEVVRLLQPFGSRILAHDILDFPKFYAEHGVSPCSLKDLLRGSDIVSLHVPLDVTTRDMLDAEHLSLLRREACLINTARGGLVDEVALRRMLTEGRLRAAAFDVFESEPSDSPLIGLPNFLCTAHMAGNSEQATLAMGQAAIRALTDHAPASEYTS